jgi:diguanylate cyclase (GGDEF)-like protein
MGVGMSVNESTWGFPRRRPYLLLAVVAFAGAVQAFAVAAFPPDASLNRSAYVVIGAASLLIAILLVTVGPWVGPRLLSAVVMLATLLIVGVSLFTRTGEGQLLAGFSLTLLGVFSAYFLSIRTVYAFLALATVLYSVSLFANPQLSAAWYGLVVSALNIGVTLVVASLARHLRRLALHDPLTGALNRQALADGAERAHLLDERSHVPTTVVEIDLDGFKQYNDEHGHSAGDDLLAGIVRDWSSVLRRTDLLARTGGDEFVLILPATDAVEAESLLQRMRDANPAPWSAGTSVWHHGEQLPEALRHADEAMYRRKPAGGSRERHQGRD